MSSDDAPRDAAGDEAAEDADEAAEAADEHQAAEEDQAPDARGPSLAGVGVAVRSVRFAWAVALLSLVVAVVAGAWAGNLTLQQQRGAEALQVGEAVAEQVTTFQGGAIDEWVAETQELATGEYAEHVDGLFDEGFRDALRENEVESQGEVRDAYLQRLDGDTAVVFVVAQQSSTNALRDDPVEDELRMEITLSRAGGAWQASDIAVLGPAPETAPGESELDENLGAQGGDDEGD